MLEDLKQLQPSVGRSVTVAEILQNFLNSAHRVSRPPNRGNFKGGICNGATAQMAKFHAMGITHTHF